MTPSPFDHIRIILVEPRGSANVGSTARAMKNFGLSDLCLVKPFAKIDGQARGMASKAQDVLCRATRHASLESAIGDCRYVVGFTASEEKGCLTRLDFDAAMQMVFQDAAHSRIGFLFGREDWGLDHMALDRCRYVTQIPTSPLYASLNLAQAVLVVGYSLFRLAHQAPAIKGPEQISEDWLEAPVQDREGLYDDITQTLAHIGYINPETSISMLRYMRRMVERMRLATKEVRILRGICRQMRWAKDSGRLAAGPMASPADSQESQY